MSNLYDLFTREQLIEQLAVIDFDEHDFREVLFTRQRMVYEYHQTRTNKSGICLQMTLGELIDTLESFPFSASHANVVFDDKHKISGALNSFRGVNSELSVEYTNTTEYNSVTLIRFIQILLSNINNTFFGWKGGEYKMTRNTPLWVANSGRSRGFQLYDDVDEYACLQAIVGVKLDAVRNVVYLETDGVILC